MNPAKPPKAPLTPAEKEARAAKSIAALAAKPAWRPGNKAPPAPKPKEDPAKDVKEDSEDDGTPPRKPARKSAKAGSTKVAGDDEMKQPAKKTKRPADEALESGEDKPKPKPKKKKADQPPVEDGPAEKKPKKKAAAKKADTATDHPKNDTPIDKKAKKAKEAPVNKPAADEGDLSDSAYEDPAPQRSAPKPKPNINAQHGTNSQKYLDLLDQLAKDIVDDEDQATLYENIDSEGVWKGALSGMSAATWKLQDIVKAGKDVTAKEHKAAEGKDGGDDGGDEGEDGREQHDGVPDGDEAREPQNGDDEDKGTGEGGEADAVQQLNDAVEDGGGEVAKAETNAAEENAGQERTSGERSLSDVMKDIAGYAAGAVGLQKPDTDPASGDDVTREEVGETNEDDLAAEVEESADAGVSANDQAAKTDLTDDGAALDGLVGDDDVSAAPVPSNHDQSNTLSDDAVLPHQGDTVLDDDSQADATGDLPKGNTADDNPAQGLQDQVQSDAATALANQANLPLDDGQPSVTGQHFKHEIYPRYSPTPLHPGQF